MAEAQTEKQNQGTFSADFGDAESAIGETEKWEDWETKLVGYSVGTGVGVLIIAGILVEIFFLG